MEFLKELFNIYTFYMPLIIFLAILCSMPIIMFLSIKEQENTKK